MRIRDSVLISTRLQVIKLSGQINTTVPVYIFLVGLGWRHFVVEVPRRMGDPLTDPEIRGLYDNKSRFAVICTCQESHAFSIDVWNLVTEQLSMGAIQRKAGITAIAMAPNDVWSIISPSLKWRKPKKPGQVDSTISFRLASFDSSDGTVHQTSFTLNSSPRVNVSDYMSPVSPLILFKSVLAPPPFQSFGVRARDRAAS
jgi:hypothetical protein